MKCLTPWRDKICLDKENALFIKHLFQRKMNQNNSCQMQEFLNIWINHCKYCVFISHFLIVQNEKLVKKWHQMLLFTVGNILLHNFLYLVWTELKSSYNIFLNFSGGVIFFFFLQRTDPFQKGVGTFPSFYHKTL